MSCLQQCLRLLCFFCVFEQWITVNGETTERYHIRVVRSVTVGILNAFCLGRSWASSKAMKITMTFGLVVITSSPRKTLLFSLALATTARWISLEVGGLRWLTRCSLRIPAFVRGVLGGPAFPPMYRISSPFGARQLRSQVMNACFEDSNICIHFGKAKENGARELCE